MSPYVRVYIDSNLGHHIADGCEDLCDTCADWIAVCDECADSYEGDPNWTCVGNKPQLCDWD